MDIKKEYSKLWNYRDESLFSDDIVSKAQSQNINLDEANMGVIESLFISCITDKGQSVMKSVLPLVMTLEASQPIIEQMETESRENTAADDENGCPLCESYTKSISMLSTMMSAMESAAKPIPERFYDQRQYLVNKSNEHKLFHVRNDDILSVKDRLRKMSSKLTDDANELIYGNIAVVEGYEGDMKSLVDAKSPYTQHKLILEITEKQFASCLMDIITTDGSPLEIVHKAKQLISIANANSEAYGFLLESAELSDDTKSLLAPNKKSTTDVKKYKDLPKRFMPLVNSTFGKVKKMGKEQQIKAMVNDGLYRKFLTAIKYIIVANVVGYFSWVLAVIVILVMLARQPGTDIAVRQEIIRELQGDLRIVREKISDANNEGDKKRKYELMRIENSLTTNLDKLQRTNSYEETRAEAGY